jgi:hypothetical protein
MLNKRYYIVLLIFFLTSYYEIYSEEKESKTKKITLKFSKFILEERGYNYTHINIKALKGYKIKKIPFLDDGWLE